MKTVNFADNQGYGNNRLSTVISGGIEYSRLMAICQEIPHVVLANSDWKIDGVPRVVYRRLKAPMS